MFLFIKTAWHRLSTTIRSKNTDYPLFSKSRWNAEQQLLTIDINTLSSDSHKITMTGWERGIEIVLWLNGRPELRDPFQASLFPIEFFELPLLQPWTDTLPTQVLSILKCYPYNPLGFLQIISQDQAAYQLFLDHSLLFMLHYQQAKRQQLGLVWLVQQCQGKRRHIMQSCGLPPQPAAVKLLKKIVFERFDYWHIEFVQELFRLDYSKLSHVPHLSERLLRTIIQHPSLLDTRLLQHWQDHEVWDLVKMTSDVHLMQTGRDSPKRIFEAVRTSRHLDDVTRLHDRLVQRNYRNRNAIDVGLPLLEPPNDIDLNLPFPEPPIMGNDNIIPLTNYAELLEESQTQQHCVASYHSKIIDGNYYVYRIFTPERATLGVTIHKSSSGKPVVYIDQLKGWQNKVVSDEILQIVKAWMQQ